MTTEKRRRSSRRTPVRRKAFPWKYVAGGGFLVVCAIISLFVVSSDDVVEYNDKTVVIVQSMDKVYEKYCQELFKYSSGQEADVAFMTKERKRIEKKVKQYRSKLKALTVPDCDLCRTFHICLIAYVKNAVKFYVKFK